MNRSEFEKRYGTERGYAHIIFVPHARAYFRKLKVSHRLIGCFAVFLAITMLLSGYFAFMYFANVREASLARSTSTKAVQRELAASNEAMVRSYASIERLAYRLMEEQLKKERELAALQKRYDQLSALASGQEQIAAAHRAILSERSTRDRLIENALSFSIGVLSSLVATFLLNVWSAPKVPIADEGRKDVDR